MQGIAEERGHFKNKITGVSEKTHRQKIGLQLLAVFALVYRAAHKYQHSDVAVCSVTVCKMHFARLFFVSVFVEWRTE